ncbi:MAG TPA: NCS1 family nucleobase:cation symporter-1 [Gemmatimonadales bacterium]|jgi:NCS1 family nucleobase:cation symporter-1|nr:NCS1 family nucleobase:cation symporter-1 [Gemmatimonadales bacterium]
MSELVELAEALPPSPYQNADLAPVPVAGRTWNLWHFASLWVGLSVCIPTYMLAASLVGAGMNWWQSLLTILLGNAIVLVPLAINAHAGTRYGIPFPVYARAAFGLRGAHLPALLRSVVACGWFGIQTWIGGLAISEILGIVWPAWSGLGGTWTFMGFGLPAYLGFTAFWLMNLWFVWKGTESIKWLETLSAPFLIAIGLALLWWAASRVGGLGATLTGSDVLIGAPAAGRSFGALFLPWLTAMVGFWATLALSIPDFTRYARSQRDQVLGQALGLLTTMPLFAFIGVAVTSATVTLYGKAIWNPVELVGRLSAETHSPMLAVLALVAILVATLTTNIAANIVAPANALANLNPRRITARLGGVLAALVGIAILPWKLLDAYQTWLLSYSGLLGAVGGVLVCDYLVVRRGVLRLRDLYLEGGAYSYRRGVNRRAVSAAVAGAGTALAGTLHPRLGFLFSGAWFSAGIVSSILYYLLMRPAAVRAESLATEA